MKKEIRFVGWVWAILLCSQSLVIAAFAQEFDKPFDVRERLGLRSDTLIATAFNGSHVYVSWISRNDETFRWQVNLAHSSDGGGSFDDPVILHSEVVGMRLPELIAKEDTVYVAFVLGITPHDLFFCKLNLQGDGPCRLVVYDINYMIDNMRMAVAENKVYIAWNGQVFGFDVRLIVSTNNGATFSQPITLTDDPRVQRRVTDLIATGEDVYVKWTVAGQPFLLHGVIMESDLKIW